MGTKTITYTDRRGFRLRCNNDKKSGRRHNKQKNRERNGRWDKDKGQMYIVQSK